MDEVTVCATACPSIITPRRTLSAFGIVSLTPRHFWCVRQHVTDWSPHPGGARRRPGSASQRPVLRVPAQTGAARHTRVWRTRAVLFAD
jgi:hypothetical protein